ncbi:PAS domain S-box-containing protein/diguanylate cyclase (GGDEF)-like protein [Roseibium hamelinense]|uniref:PAS domain S-box-containing protein/diguanylate cyclase (GGDEF)-like protein n=1 Tax=Roseibium hamelinense TaxID=150831 RepID=A0A562THX1_9HYPH|nr:diguanylate cyclase [Roseibium hamelinense]TWI93289.1 PAS domain S-box-containing protein/diguanylate cyclase (GGDEF)-like protein [Roseibium hamelinense]
MAGNQDDMSGDRLAAAKTDTGFSELLEASPVAALGLSRGLGVAYASGAVAEIFGWQPEDLMDRGLSVLMSGEGSLVMDALKRLDREDGPPVRKRCQLATKNGDLIWTDVTAKTIQTRGGSLLHVGLYLQDASTHVALEKTVTGLRRHDEQTGLENRRGFHESLQREWAVARREKAPVSLILIEIDKYYGLTDINGGTAGADLAARAIADILKSTTRRAADAAARLDDSRFALLLPRTPEAGARTISDYVRQAIADRKVPNLENEDRGGVTTVSIGTATGLYVERAVDAASGLLFKRAEEALDLAREQGGNRIETAVIVLQAGDGSD